VALKFLAHGASKAHLAAAIQERGPAGSQNRPSNVLRVYDISEADARSSSHGIVTARTWLTASPHRRLTATSDASRTPIVRRLAPLTTKACLAPRSQAANVMIDGHGQVRIAFGIAGGFAGPARRPLAGTPNFHGPGAVCRWRAIVRSDLYSLGIVLYQVLRARAFRDASFPVARP